VEIDAPDIEITSPTCNSPPLQHVPGPHIVQGHSDSPPTSWVRPTVPDAGSLKQIERLSITRVILKADTGIQDLAFWTT